MLSGESGKADRSRAVVWASRVDPQALSRAGRTCMKGYIVALVLSTNLPCPPILHSRELERIV